MGHPVVHWEIAGTEAKKLREFYSALFDWKVEWNDMANYGAVETGGEGGIDGGIMQTPEGVPAYLTFYVQVDDLQEYLDKAKDLGGEAVVPPTPIPGVGSFAMFQDPEGNMVGIFKEGA